MNIAARANKAFGAGSNNLMELVHLRANIAEGKSQKLFHIFLTTEAISPSTSWKIKKRPSSRSSANRSKSYAMNSTLPRASFIGVPGLKLHRQFGLVDPYPLQSQRHAGWREVSKALLPSAARRSSKGCLHGIIPRPSAPLGANPVDSFVRVPDVTSLAMNAI